MTTKPDCDDMHDEWYERRAKNRVQLLILSMLGASLGTASIVLFFLVSNAITKHELETQTQLVTRREFEATIGRIETRMQRLDESVNQSMQAVVERLDRNLEAIKTHP